MLSIFSCVYEPPVCLLWRNVCLVLWPTFDRVACFSGTELLELYILEINYLAVVLFANIFSLLKAAF